MKLQIEPIIMVCIWIGLIIITVSIERGYTIIKGWFLEIKVCRYNRHADEFEDIL